MLAPDARAVLLDQLRPPVGYRLDAAVATTFTLDLAAALVPALAFAAFQLRSTPDPVAALEAVRSCADRVDVFCQAGQITVPAQASDLVAFLEPMVHVVNRPRRGHLFHPKVWLLRYASDDDTPQHRLLCVTRNLTRDQSWDTVVRLDGTATGGPKAANRPLVELIRSLPGRAVTPLPDGRRQRITSLADEVRRVVWEHPDDVNEINFHVFGVPSVRPAADFSGYRHLVVAPFLNDRGLDTVARDSPDATVVSRVDDLNRLSPASAARITPYVVSAIAGLDEPTDPDDRSDPDDRQILAGLHAKIYVVERNRRAHVFIGSANATDAAFGGNVELLVELVGGATKLGIDTFLAPGAPFRTLLEEYDTAGGADADPVDEAQRALDDLVRDLAAIAYTATVSTDGDGHRIKVTSDRSLPIPTGYDVTAELLTRPGEARILAANVPAGAEFTGVPLADITPFVVLRVRSAEGLQRGTVVRATLINDPTGRLDEILARQVDTSEKFLRFLALLLGLADPGLLPWGNGQGGRVRLDPVAVGPGVFELVLRALADGPDALVDLDRLVQRLQATQAGRRILPHGFDVLWPTVLDAHRRLQEVTVR
jgi:hypothetical protein